MKIVDESTLFFSKVSLLKFFLEAPTFRGCKGIYSSVYEKCEKSFFIKQGIPATQPCD